MHNARTALHVDTKSDLINRTVGRNEEYRKPSLRQILNLVSLFLYEDRIKRRHRTKTVSGIILKNDTYIYLKYAQRIIFSLFLGFSSQRKTFEDSFGGGEGQGFIDSKESINRLMTETHENSQTNRRAVITEIGSAERKVKDKITDDFMEKYISMEQINMLEKAPIYQSVGQFLDGYELGQDEDDNQLISTLEEVEKRNRNSNVPLNYKNSSHQNINHIIFEKLKLKFDEKNDIGGTNSLISVLSGPYMSLTTEENNRINNLVGRTQQILKSCCPVSLYQARIENFMGILSMEDMLKLFTLSRKATNFVHYNKMLNVPFFTELTTR